MLVEHLLQREEVTNAVVERTGIDALVGITCHCRNRHCPTMLVQTRRMGHHATPAVVTVGVGEAQAGPGSIISRKGLDVVGAANTTKTIEVLLQTHTDGLVPECLVQATRHRIIEREANTIIEGDAVNVGLGLLVLIATNAETHRAEGVARGLIERVVGSTAQQCHFLGVAFLIL